ncbi:response regulator [Fulvivirga lutimaris]|uniref:response regulator n=1 Tax=Fulvivirga lutimaris TaxID=1819566 RepID=UPI0012BCDB01|nr:response regulator [Fulvivirga lutimaris]MTI40060.1 response regulator [Fulvivirga lutimaris]
MGDVSFEAVGKKFKQVVLKNKMSAFSFSKVDKFRQSQETDRVDLIDIKFPSEMAKPKVATQEKELLIFVVDDDPTFMQILNTHFSKLTLKNDKGDAFQFKVKNYATGRSCIGELDRKPDLIFLNYYINKGMPNALTGKDTLNKIIEINPNQKVLILDDLNVKLRGAFVENGLRDYIIKDISALEELNSAILDIINREN